MIDSASTFDTLVHKAQRLCSLPAVAMKVLELTANPQVDTHALKQCIENDPALTSKILRVVNSSLFGLSREVSDLNQALALLGSKPLKLLVLGFSLPGNLFAGVSGEVLGRYWRRTLTKAVAGRELSELVWHLPGDEAFIAGLLQDLGMLVLIQEWGAPYITFLELVSTAGRELTAVEFESLGFSHTTLSARLLEHWGLPQSLVEAVGWDPARQPLDDLHTSRQVLPQIVHLAELIARLLVDGQSHVLREVLQVGENYRNLSKAQLESLVGSLEEKVAQLADVLSLQLPDGVSYQDVLELSQAQLSEVAAAAAGDLVQRQADREPPIYIDQSLVRQLQRLSKMAGDAASATGFTAAAASGSLGLEPAAATTEPSAPASTAPRAARSGRASATVELDPGLLGRLEAAVAACRQSRCSLSLLLVELNQFDKLLFLRGIEGVERLRRLLQALCQKLDHPGEACVPYGEAGFALVLTNCDRRQVVQLGNELANSARRLGAPRGAALDQAFTISVGAATVALPPKNFVAEDLVTAAQRCLYGAHTSGGSVVKSIEIY